LGRAGSERSFAGGTEIARGAGGVAELAMEFGTFEVGLAELGIEGDGAIEALERLFKLIGGDAGMSSAAMESGVVRFERDCLVEVGDGFAKHGLRLVAEIKIAAIHVGDGIVGRVQNGLFEIAKGVAGVADLGVGKAAIVQGDAIVGVSGEMLVERSNDGLVFVELVEEQDSQGFGEQPIVFRSGCGQGSPSELAKKPFVGSYNCNVEKQVRLYRSHKEADAADAARDKALTPEERVKITIELFNQHYPDAAAQRFARVCRVIKLERS